MNVQTIRLRLTNFNRHMKNALRNIANRGQRDDQQHVMNQEEKIDEAIEESFPASDPPGHLSKSLEDRELH